MNFNDSFSKLFRYASPRSVCVSGYKSAAHTPDSGPSADFSTVTLYGNGMKVIDQACSEHPAAPGWTSEQLHESPWPVLVTHGQYHRGYMTALISFWPLKSFLNKLRFHVCSFCYAQLHFSSVIFLKNMTLWLFLPEEKKWNLITPDYAVKLQACATLERCEHSFFSPVDLKICNNGCRVYLYN